jgi:hypothetical protein
VSTQANGVIPASVHYVAPWCNESDIPQGRLTDSNGQPLQDIQMGWMIAAATDLLYVLSGRRWRSGHSVVRPTATNRAIAYGSMTYPLNTLPGFGYGWGFAAGWMWSMLGLGFSQGSDSTEVVLQAPVTSIEQILLNGVPLTTDQYSLTDRRRLTLSSGLAWPWEQDPQMDPSQNGTAQVIYDWGSSPPEAGRLACAELAIELALSFSGQDSCKLPARVLTVATQGVNVAVGDAMTFLLQDLTGIALVDLFLRAVNPQRLRRRSQFVGPGTIIQRES